MRSFFRNIKDSIYSPEFYRTIELRSFSEVFKYYSKLIAIIALLITIAGSILILPFIVDVAKRVGVVVTRDYPKDLTINIEKGIATSNLKIQPYLSGVPAELSGAKIDGKPLEHLIVIDTRSSLDVTKFISYNTYAMLSKDSLAVREDKGKVSMQTLVQLPDIKLDYDTASTYASRLPTLVKTFAPGIVVLGFVAAFLSYVVVLAYLAIIALFVWLIALIKGLSFSYGTSYKVAIYSATLPIILNFVLLANQISVPWLFTLISLLVVSINLRKMEVIPSIKI